MKFFMPLFALALQILLTAGALAQTSGCLRMADAMMKIKKASGGREPPDGGV
jgi:hypothetical protein